MKKNYAFKINRDYLIRISIEMFSVVFAVFLALLIDEWRSNKANQQLAEKAYTNIITELSTNKESLTATLVVHDSLLRIMDSAIIRIEKNDTNLSVSINGFNFGLLSDAAWEATKNTNAINFMDFDNIMDISSAYDVQKIYSKQMDGFLNDQLLGLGNDTQKDRISQLYLLQSYITRLNSIGHQLINIYEEVITKLESGE